MDKLMMGAPDPAMNVPLTAGGNLSAMSPYLNFDPGFLQQQGPEYILMEGVDKNKGVSHYCYQVGAPVMIGALIGGAQGTVLGWKQALNVTGREGRAVFLNTVRDQVKLRCQPFGACATIFSLTQFGMSCVRDTEDGYTYMTCGTLTGMIYKSTAGGLKHVARGGLAGLVITGALCMAKLVYNNNGTAGDLMYRVKNSF